MLADYRFFRVADGVPAFAWVYVETVPRSDNAFTVRDDTAGATDSVDRGSAPEWIEAATRGCWHAVEWIRQFPSIHGCDVHLRKVQGTIADTREDAVECAAFLATAKAFARLNDTTILFDDRWIVTPR
jgi:hypothetical protein